ncbi:Hypothetical predicted protein [Mytilus galloprovincialis]|uniref:HTH psq-type domain-containing protein n=2 Tax=Mytilus galloprovincialis TaxID=29158 RepID=A0A8B6BG39_MYTGA|nr:Hypothetical predicted protein [Mytilus galloprovincialis]
MLHLIYMQENKVAFYYLLFLFFFFRMLRVKKTKSKELKYDITALENAIRSVKSGEMSVRKAAQHFNVPKSTVGDRVTGKRDLEVGRGRKPALPLELEKSIVQSVKRASQLGVGLSRKQLLTRTGALVKKLKIKTPFKNSTPGKDWWQSLKERHPDLTIRKPEKTGALRCRMMNRQKVEAYFQDLGLILTQKNLLEKPKMIWNMDECGKSFEHNPVKVVAEKGAKNVPGRTSAISTHVTIVACVNAMGDKMSPLLVVKGKTERSIFGFNTQEAPSGTMWDYQESGWMDDRIGERWFKEIFLKQCGNDRPQILILDGHSSHESLALIQEGIKEDVVVLSLPPHTTHYLQPLDRTVFGPFSKQYDRACSEFLQQNILHKVDKWTFPTLFHTAWNSALTNENIKSGFRACGIYPFNPLAIPECAYLPSEPSQYTEQSNSVMKSTEAELPSTSASALGTSTEIEAIETMVPSGDGPVSNVNHSQILPLIADITDSLQQPEIDDPQHLLELILQNKIEVVATANEEGVAAVSDMWNAEVTSLFLPFSNVSENKKPTEVKKTKTASHQSHRLLTSEEVVQEKLLLAKKKEEKENKKLENKLKKAEREMKKVEQVLKKSNQCKISKCKKPKLE